VLFPVVKMAVTLAASEEGLKIFEQARTAKGWNKTVGKNSPWSEHHITKATLERFHKRELIKHENFVAICLAVGIDDWEKIADRTEIVKTEEIAISVSTELDIFSQQIFDWFQALRFEIEGDPKCDRNYVEVVIRVPVRSGFDRVLVQIVTHEAVLTDLDGFRQAVGEPHRQVDGGWLITKSWVSQAVKDALKESGDRRLTCLTFDELIDQDANFTPYLDWLEREISKREIDLYYVDLGCTKGEFDADTRTLRGTSKYIVADGGIDRYIDRWLENPVTEHVSILGEFGTGKTWFALHYAGKCLQAYREAKSKGLPRPRLPLVIPLRDYAKALNVENVLAGFFYTQHNIRLNSDVFDRLNRMGKLLLIFDGFDEMADKIDTQKMTDNFWELAKVVTPNAKVILTCRTEHFPKGEDERDNFEGKRLPSNANKIAVAPKFETLELMKFDDEQIREVLSRRTNVATVELVMANSQLLDLLRRAVMAEFVLEALPEIEAGKPIDLARVYLYAVRHKMERDITTGRTFTSLADKLYFLCELAWEMLSEDKTKGLNYREFPNRLQDLFGKEVADKKHLDHWHYDMMGQTMLIRNDDGDYSPAHRSLLEFFVAYKLAAELGLLAADFLEMAQKQSGIDQSLEPQFYTWSGYWQREVDDKGARTLIAPLAGFKSESLEKLRDTFGKSPLTKAILNLLLPALNLEIKYRESNLLFDLIKSTKAAEVGYLGGNAATALVALNSHVLEYQDLNDTNLANADLVNAGLRGTDLSDSNLENCLVTRMFGSVNVIIMSKDDRYFITAHDDKTIRIWDRVSGIELQKLIRHKGFVTCLALNEDRQLLYSGSDDGTIKEWNLVDGTYQHTFEHQSSVNAITLSKDGQFLYSGSDDGTIKEWRLANGICQRTFSNNQSSVNVIALSIDGQFLYFGSNDGTIKEWRLVDGICQRTFSNNQRRVKAISMSIDGQFLYSSSGDCTIKEWRLADGICQRTFEDDESFMDVIALSENAELLYSGSRNGAIQEWKIADGSCQKIFEIHQHSLRCLALSRNGQFLYSGGSDSGSNNGTIEEWKIVDGKYQRTFHGYQDSVKAIAVSRDKQFLYFGSSNGKIQEWRMSDGTCTQAFDGHQYSVNCLTLSEDEKLLYSGSDDREIREWNLNDGICQRTFIGHKGSIDLMNLSENGQSLYSYGSNFGDDREIKEWNLADGICQDTFPHYGGYGSIVLQDDEYERSLYLDNNNLLGKEWRKIKEHSLQYTFADDPKLLSVDKKLLYSSSADGLIKEWDVETGECLRTIDPRLCAGANITNVKGLTTAQTASLIALGAIDNNK
jgi:predicted NACHT family NTPase